MKTIIKIKEVLEEIHKGTRERVVEAEKADLIVAKEYYLGRSAGLDLAIRLLKTYIDDEMPWEE